MLDLNGFEKKKERKKKHNTKQHQFTQLLKSSLSTIVCVREKERERERERGRERETGRCCVASLKKNLPCIFFFFLIYVIDLQENRCTTFRVCTIGRLKVKENEKMSPPKYFFLFLMLTSLASSRIKFRYSSKLYKA